MKKIINNKLIEHVSEIEATQQEIEIEQQKFFDNKNVETARHMMILKDKILFHKACSMVLQELLDEADKKENK